MHQIEAPGTPNLIKMENQSRNFRTQITMGNKAQITQQRITSIYTDGATKGRKTITPLSESMIMVSWKITASQTDMLELYTFKLGFLVR